MYPLFICPYCDADTLYIQAVRYDTIAMARATCEHCHKEFLIVNDTPVKKESYKKTKLHAA